MPAVLPRAGGNAPAIAHCEVPAEHTGGERVREAVEGEGCEGCEPASGTGGAGNSESGCATQGCCSPAIGIGSSPAATVVRASVLWCATSSLSAMLSKSALVSTCDEIHAMRACHQVRDRALGAAFGARVDTGIAR